MEDYTSKLSNALLPEHWRIVRRYNDNYINQRLQRLAGSALPEAIEAYIVEIAQDNDKAMHFVENLNNSTSCFFRNNYSFSVLQQVVLPEIIARKTQSGSKTVRVWSMAAAGGQELYSVAILLDELRYLHGGNIDVKLFASDIDEQQIQFAQAGRYKYKDIEQVTEKRLKHYFSVENGECFVVDKKLIEGVSFNKFDLTDDNCSCPPESVFGDFDLIICANVLIYYDKESVSKIFDKIAKCMANKAYVMTSESERDMFQAKGFVEHVQQSGIFIRK